ncbi:hypothetical protein NUW54_g8202 [Trametes sanguinea]|uniref:Uncharacterized protein n=1 Tax=Trametes sanguinea TaxID=158606 RepID=A0ACC1PHI9_9APHY|nr:hypothetical protein NUW54_g8202 [Trametes sanguinea]
MRDSSCRRPIGGAPSIPRIQRPSPALVILAPSKSAPSEAPAGNAYDSKALVQVAVTSLLAWLDPDRRSSYAYELSVLSAESDQGARELEDADEE